jgi:hypothetical protein
MTTPEIKARLEELRAEIRAERISYGEIAELQGLAEHIEPEDVELLEWAGVPEFPEEAETIYTVTVGVPEDEPSPTEEDVKTAILRYCTDQGLSVLTCEVARA